MKESTQYRLRGQQKQDKISSASAKATAIVSLSMLLSRILGFVREISLAPTIGYGINTDAYFIGFQIPDLVYQLLIGGALTAAITPSVAVALTHKREERLWRALSTFINFATLLISGAIIIGEIIAPLLIKAYNPDKSPELLAIATKVTRALFPQVLLLFISSILGAILYGYKAFARSAFIPLVYNIVFIFFIFYWGDKTADGPVRIAFGVVIAAGAAVIFAILMSRRELRFYRFAIDLKDRFFKHIVRLALPALLSGTVLHVNFIIQTAFTNQYEGAVTALQHCRTTWNTPYGVFIVAIANVLTPTLSAHYAKRDYRAMRKSFTQSMRRGLFLIMPFAIAFAVMGEEVIEAIYQWNGAIPYDRLVIEASLLRIYAVVMIIYTITYFYMIAFFSRQNTRIALIVSIISLAVTPLFSHLFCNVAELGVIGLPLALVVDGLVAWLFLRVVYRISLPQAKPYPMWTFAVRLLVISVPTAIVMLALNTLPIDLEQKIPQLLYFVLKSLISFGVYYLSGIAIGLREAKYFQGMLRRVLHLPEISCN